MGACTLNFCSFATTNIFATIFVFQVQDFLVEAHGELQKYYNVLKLISENATARGDEVAKDFADTVCYLFSTLTEMKELMSAQEIPTDEVDYKEVPANIFVSDRTSRMIRDWIVLRDYTAYLHYFLRVLRHLDAKSPWGRQLFGEAVSSVVLQPGSSQRWTVEGNAQKKRMLANVRRRRSDRAKLIDVIWRGEGALLAPFPNLASCISGISSRYFTVVIYVSICT